MIRTFSKSFALAGARVGYALADADTAAELNRRQAPQPISGISAALALLGLSDPPDVRWQVEERERCARALRALGLAPFPSATNFLFVPLEDPESIARKFKRAVTDSDGEVRFDPENKPGVSNLLQILGALRDEKPENVAAGYTQYGPLKADAGEAVIEALRPVRERATELLADRGQLAALLHQGADKARTVASATLDRAYRAVGLAPA